MENKEGLRLQRSGAITLETANKPQFRWEPETGHFHTGGCAKRLGCRRYVHVPVPFDQADRVKRMPMCLNGKRGNELTLTMPGGKGFPPRQSGLPNTVLQCEVKISGSDYGHRASIGMIIRTVGQSTDDVPLIKEIKISIISPQM